MMTIDALNSDVDPDDLAVALVRLLRERGVKGVHVRLDWDSESHAVKAIEVRAHLPLRGSETYSAKTYVRIPCMEIKMDKTACEMIERMLGGKE